MSASPAKPLPVAKAYLGFAHAFMTVYRGELIMWAIATSLPIIMMGVWVEAGSSGKFEDFGPVEAARYFIAVFLVRQLSVCWVIYDFEYMVVTGRLSSRLMHPVDPLWYFVSMHLADQWIRLPICAVLVGLCFVLQPQALWGDAPAGGQTGWWTPEWWRFLLGFVGIYAAFTLRFLMQYTLAMMAFWHERVIAMDALLMVPYTFLSGLVIPLQVLPAPLRETLLYTPFPYMIWWPGTVLSGGDVPIVQAAVIISIWIVALWLLNRWAWRRGLRHYSAMGA